MGDRDSGLSRDVGSFQRAFLSFGSHCFSSEAVEWYSWTPVSEHVGTKGHLPF